MSKLIPALLSKQVERRELTPVCKAYFMAHVYYVSRKRNPESHHARTVDRKMICAIPPPMGRVQLLTAVKRDLLQVNEDAKRALHKRYRPPGAPSTPWVRATSPRGVTGGRRLPDSSSIGREQAKLSPTTDRVKRVMAKRRPRPSVAQLVLQPIAAVLSDDDLARHRGESIRRPISPRSPRRRQACRKTVTDVPVERGDRKVLRTVSGDNEGRHIFRIAARSTTP